MYTASFDVHDRWAKEAKLSRIVVIIRIICSEESSYRLLTYDQKLPLYDGYERLGACLPNIIMLALFMKCYAKTTHQRTPSGGSTQMTKF